MQGQVILVDILALIAVVAGAFMVFRQRLVRRLWARVSGRPFASPAGGDEDPAHYALIIFGMMLLAFGLIILAFFTSYALLT
jgi:hypothetical protein